MNKHTRQFILLAAVSLALIILDRYTYLGWLHRAIEYVTVPAQRVVFAGKQGVMNVSFGTNAADVATLEKNLAQAWVDTVELTRLQTENAALRKQLEAPLPASIDYVPAQVLGYDGAQLMLDKGAREGVAEGMAVVVEKQYVGVVWRVLATTALVETLLSPASKVPVETLDSGARGLLQMNGGTLLMDKILQEYDIRTGELVVTAGSDTMVRDLVIGSVKEVKFEPQELFKQATVTPAVAYEKLQMVFVIVKK